MSPVLTALIYLAAYCGFLLALVVVWTLVCLAEFTTGDGDLLDRVWALPPEERDGCQVLYLPVRR